MNGYLVAAASLAFVVGLAHSVIGELMIFRRLRRAGIVPTDGGNILRESNVRILWASWHVLTVLGWAMAALLLWLARPAMRTVPMPEVVLLIAVAMLAGSAFVAFGTRGRHPGWIGLAGVAALAWLGREF